MVELMKHVWWSFALVLCLVFSSYSVVPQTIEPNKTASSGVNNQILDMASQVNESLMQQYEIGLTNFRPRYTGTLNCNLASEYIYNQFVAMGLETSFHDWSFDGFKSRNVVATLPGTDTQSTAEFIICGHYDTVEVSPGADDDGSGTASVLAIASIMSKYSFNHTIKFIAFSGEENGLYGAFSYARDAYRRGENIVAVFNLDMVGYANTVEGGKVIRFFPATRAHWIAEFAIEVSEKYMDALDMGVETLPCYIGSDAAPFIDYGYDAVWIAHPDGYQWGHSADDLPEHINYTYHAKATRFMLAVLAEFASRPIPVQVVIKTPFEGYGYIFNHPVIKLDLGRQWYKGLRGITMILGRPMVSVDVFTNEPIKYVIFCIDGNFMNWDTQAPYEWEIQGLHYPPIGRHTLQVYAYTTNGHVAVDEMQIIIVSFSSQYG
jgi:hypothetical protein